jgi:hypothetical protein
MATESLVRRLCTLRDGDRSSLETSAIVFQHATGEPPRAVNKLMGDPRNVAHGKKVSQEKHHKDKHAPKAGPAPSQRTKNVQPEKKAASVAESTAPKAEAAKPTQPVEPTQLEKSLVVLTKLKVLEFHSRANI